MRLITDTFISKDHFRIVVSDENFIVFQCEINELPIMHLQLSEWVRQLEEEMKVRNIEAMI